ncbi:MULTISPECIES: hypothetical protein [Parageobacillus]|uniref:Uncharacterized protein n=1 Tax=Parageobacillus toebii NBRC 107807 TaxID=1223503 RepID=A0AA89NNI1_9BACL|nr:MULTISPECIES: hypothetical protein [Parageobacillus]MBB3869044.1 hypothetical protein [Parageobacillus toebii NBRC 107807]WMT18335.1 hypothetical protein RFB12_13685 [Parageobacillus toebii]
MLFVKRLHKQINGEINVKEQLTLAIKLQKEGKLEQSKQLL